MSKAMILALTGAMINTSNDFIYRKSGMGKEADSVYGFYFLSAVSSAAFALILGFIKSGYFLFNTSEMIYGFILGILSFFAYILFLFSFNGTNTSISVTIYRLNLIPGIVLAVIFLDEAISFKRGFGIILCLASMLLFVRRTSKDNKLKKYLVCSIAACLSGGILNMMNKVAVMHGTDSFRLLFWRFATVALISGILFKFKKSKAIIVKDLAYPIISGLLLMLAVFCIIEALKTGDVSLVIPITQLSFAVVAIISWLVLKEKFHTIKLLGVLCAILAVIFIN